MPNKVRDGWFCSLLYSLNVGILLNWLGMMLNRSLDERSRFSNKNKNKNE